MNWFAIGLWSLPLKSVRLSDIDDGTAMGMVYWLAEQCFVRWHISIQLSYQPALDPFHSVFRLLRVLPYVKSVGALPRDHVRILDFYVLFPFRISAARLTPQHRRFRKFETNFENQKPYSEQPDDVVMFSRMQPMQLTAMETLADKFIINLRRIGGTTKSSRPVPSCRKNWPHALRPRTPQNLNSPTS